MKILMVNKFFYPFGGTESYVFSLSRMLMNKGHQVVPFGMKHEDNIEEFNFEYFVENIDYNTKSFANKIQYAAKILYSFEAKKKIRNLIEKSKPDIAHLHNIYHQLSPSILGELKEHSIPTVMTAHDLKLLCPNYKMYREGNICEKCQYQRFYHAISGRCIKDSLTSSALGTLEMYLHRFLGLYSSLDKIILPSHFYKMKFIKFGFPADKLIHVPNFVDHKKYFFSCAEKRYFIYLGRLAQEKGLETLITAMEKVKDYDLYIIGDGAIKNELEIKVAKSSDSNIRFLGFQSGSKLLTLISEAMFMVTPSEWYENCPISVLEVLSMGKPVIAANVGGLPELVEDKVNGLIFKMGDAEDLSEKILYLLNNPEERRKMGKKAREKIEQCYNPALHYERIVALYQSLLESKR
jgi:glycosyltransferase involved in cell wall biosynthesis